MTGRQRRDRRARPAPGCGRPSASARAPNRHDEPRPHPRTAPRRSLRSPSRARPGAGDKSISHRSLMLGTLAVGENDRDRPARVRRRARHRRGDARPRRPRRARCRRRLAIHGVGVGGLLEPTAPLDFGNAGTGVRLCLGMVGTHPIAVTAIGDASLSRRPMGRVLGPLRVMGTRSSPATATACRSRCAARRGAADRISHCRCPRRR